MDSDGQISLSRRLPELVVQQAGLPIQAGSSGSQATLPPFTHLLFTSYYLYCASEIQAFRNCVLPESFSKGTVNFRKLVLSGNYHYPRANQEQLFKDKKGNFVTFC
jgi:hypothetical protein